MRARPATRTRDRGWSWPTSPSRALKNALLGWRGAGGGAPQGGPRRALPDGGPERGDDWKKRLAGWTTERSELVNSLLEIASVDEAAQHRRRRPLAHLRRRLREHLECAADLRLRRGRREDPPVLDPHLAEDPP